MSAVPIRMWAGPERRIAALAAHVHWRGLKLGLFATVPLLVLAILTGDLIWLKASLLGVSLVLGWQQSGLTAIGVVVQALAVTGLFLFLAACRTQPLLFSLICAAAAAGVVRLGGIGARLRTVGAFSFIPAVYMAFDGAAEHVGSSFAAALTTLPALTTSLFAVLVVMACSQWRHPRDGHGLRLFVAGGWGNGRPHTASMVAATLSVGIVAAIVVSMAMASGQWAIWSALSIVTAEAGREGRKLGERALGALVGVPFGLLLSYVLPHDRLVVEIAMLLAMLTLIAMRHYAAGIALRWCLVALAAAASGSSALAASERILDVIAGGAIGLGCVLLTRFLSRPRRLRISPPSADRISPC
jgi:hypothetical protein